MKKSIILSILLGLLGSPAFSTHIVGGNFSYECTNGSNNEFEVSLTIYRDCIQGQAPYDAQITIFVFENNTGNIAQTNAVLAPSQTPQIDPWAFGSCVTTPVGICVQQGTYKTILSLPPIPGGYNIAWARCCRNQGITNLVNPLNEGITFLTHIPEEAITLCNTSPSLDSIPPLFACLDDVFEYDFAAYEPDGDSLVYSLVSPYTGLNSLGLGAGNPMNGGNDPTVDLFNNPMGSPPYQNVNFNTGFTGATPFGINTVHNLNPSTGKLVVTPEVPGMFSYAVDIKEYRNGQLIGEYRLDYQIHVIPCDYITPNIVIEPDLTHLNASNDTICIMEQDSFCYDVTIKIPDGPGTDTITAEALGSAFGQEASFSSVYYAADSIIGTVCWEPSCNDYPQGNTIVPLIIGSRKNAGCTLIGAVYDTVWVKVIGDSTSMIYGNIPDADFGYQTQGQRALFQNISKRASKFQWKLGDNNGTSTRTREPIITYNNQDSAWVSLVAENGCGSDTNEQWVFLKGAGVNNDKPFDNTLNLSMYPNPAQDLIYLKYNQDVVRNGQIALIDINGRRLRSLTFNSTSGKVKIDVKDLNAGLYFLEIQAGEFVEVKKFIKN
ncbi:MAG: T9SS type A sorting domain-containing protein [Bacteroidia bacterium]|nr:T9SS type A sorting domain-containing protein [Bacteroidia bacterium]